MIRIGEPCICLVTDRRRLRPHARTTAEELLALDRLLDEALGAGVDLIQIREPDVPAGQLRDFAAGLLRRRARALTRVVINDRADVAMAAGADGVHLRSDGISAADARALAPAWLVGRSAHSVDEVAQAGPVDYLVCGTVFETSSKPASLRPAGIEGLRRMVGAAQVPVLAIGGMTPERAAGVRRAGAAGIAAISVFFAEGASTPGMGAARATAAFRAAMAADIC